MSQSPIMSYIAKSYFTLLKIKDKASAYLEGLRFANPFLRRDLKPDNFHPSSTAPEVARPVKGWEISSRTSLGKKSNANAFLRGGW